jgi:hypothetical protein
MNPTNKFLDTLPKTLPGVVCAQRVRCGKPNCHCTTGERHLAYYRFWREGGRLRKCYVKRADLAIVRACCQERQRARKALASAWAQWRQLVSIIQEIVP